MTIYVYRYVTITKGVNHVSNGILDLEINKINQIKSFGLQIMTIYYF